MFGKRFLKTSSSLVLSASLVSMVQNAGVFADEETKLAVEKSVEESVDFLETKGKVNSIVEDTFNNANCVGKAKEEEAQVTKFEDLGTSPVLENNENSDGLGEVSASGGGVANNVVPTVEQGKRQFSLSEHLNILRGIKQLLKEKIKKLEERKGKISQKIKELKRVYEEEKKKLNLEYKELTKEINEIKDELGIWRLKTWDEIYRDTPLFVKIFLLLCLLYIFTRFSLIVIFFFTGISISRVIRDALEPVCVLVSNTLDTVEHVGYEFKEGLKAVKNCLPSFGVRSGYKRIPAVES